MRKDNSLPDWGTYTSNAILTGNYNATKEVESEHYEQIREFMTSETDAFLVSATLHHFGMTNMKDTPKKNLMPSGMQKANNVEKRTWLHNQMSEIFDTYVSGTLSGVTDEKESIETLADQNTLPCRALGCSKTFKYSKCRVNHENQKHDLYIMDDKSGQESEETKPTEDHIFNYGCIHISLGLMLRNAEDAVKEGDGLRLLRAWKFFTYLFHLKGHNKYALAGLRLIASVEGLLTPRQAHRLTWNRFAGKKGGKGKRISRDLRVEQLNKISKEEIRALGFPNINDKSVQNATRTTAAMEQMVINSKADLGIEARSGHHCNKEALKQFGIIFDQVHTKANVFSFKEGRYYGAFPDLSSEIYHDLSPQQLYKWIKMHRDRWNRQHRHLYRVHK